MAQSANEDPSFWKLQDIEPTYWDEYIATRPLYDSMVQHICKYHTDHSNSFQTAIDIGAGAGSTAGLLVERFRHVVASDNDPISQAFIKQRYSHLPPESLSFTLSSGEDLLKYHQPGSFDLITCAETFPLMDTQVALNNIHTLLRPGGTLAVWFYAPPFFTEGDVALTCQPILDSIMDHNFRPVVSGGNEARRAAWKRATDGKFSWLDYIPLPADRWEDVHRHKWNPNARLSFFTPGACDFPIDITTRVGTHEMTSQEHNSSFWGVRWDMGVLRRFVKASFPKPRGLDAPDDTMEALFEDLTEAMGGPTAERALSWPAVLILATKIDEA
ncbi:S-adenosyl-L-methionine-dependent methyltransferase [Xylariaceae sp. FL0255]|nr:S-adenosyl-L-methionine-dependent methyltransferase [Xylariaceae sp. FL0255]